MLEAAKTGNLETVPAPVLHPVFLLSLDKATNKEFVFYVFLYLYKEY
jgi:hypothetical protein